jgi:predicted metal-dependent phosphoesterase TrpH
MKQAQLIKSAQLLPNGARFYRCALQVNPYDYLVVHKKRTSYSDEAAYNRAIVDACKKIGIEVIAITDHHRVSSSVRLREEARAAGIHVFPGFEATTKDGVHLLCLFDPQGDRDLERVLGDCGIHDDSGRSSPCKYDAIEFLNEASEWEAICIAAHVDSNDGLLARLTGQPRVNAWRSPKLMACSLSGSAASAPDGIRDILQDKVPEYRREPKVAILNALDVNDPADLEKPQASCWIKMSAPTAEGLRQAFLDPDSRIRLSHKPDPHTEFVAMAWESSGFLEGARVHFNENLNVLIGGRGTGKSTVIESLRYVLGLDPVGDDARKLSAGIINHVLRSGTKVSLLVRSYLFSEMKEYLIERTIPNPPVVRDEQGNVLPLTPHDVVSGAEIFGQHEIAELTKSPDKLTRLLDRFREPDSDLSRKKAELRRELERSRSRILDAQRELKVIEDRLAALPGLEETLMRFKEAGLEEKLKDQSLLVREERVLNAVSERFEPFNEILNQLRDALPIDRAFLSPRSLEGLPGRAILEQAETVLAELDNQMAEAISRMAAALDHAGESVTAIRSQWNERKREVQSAYEKILRELQKSRVDGEEFIRLRRQIEELRPLDERQAALRRSLEEHQQYRRNLSAEWDDTKTEEFRRLGAAAKKVNRQLSLKVRVSITFAGNRSPFIQLLRDQVGGRLSEALDTLGRAEQLSLREFADACRAGRDVVARKYGIPPSQADRLAQASVDVLMQIEELDLPPTTRIELNVGGEGDSPVYKSLEALSTGQKATAVLLLLLLESDAPLIVDQPEDDLDNRFITDGVVPKMRKEKQRRQFIFATHNANIPVLGDAELIIGLQASGEAGQGHAEILPEHMGSIDDRAVRELVEEILEGGKEAFEMRRLKYGF